MKQLTQEIFKELVYYDYIEGQLFWNKRNPDTFNDNIKTREQVANSWNARFAGKKAFSNEVGNGYKSGTIIVNGVKHRISHHRGVWFWNYGYWPKNVDHINHDKANDRLINLRDVSKLENSQNASKPITNKSGHTGVSHRLINGIWNGRWRAIGWNNGKRSYLGDFETIDKAVEARRNFLNSIITYHDNHGK